MKMKVKLRKAGLLLLLVTVFAPIVLYSEILGAHFTSPSSRSDFVEDISAFTYAGEFRPLNVLPQESSSVLKEPLGVVYSEKSSPSSLNFSDADASTGVRKNAFKTRQLTEESVEQENTVTSSESGGGAVEGHSVVDNLIRQVTDTEGKAHEGGENSEKPLSTGESESERVQLDATSGVNSQESKHTSNDASRKKETNHEKHSSRRSRKHGARVSEETRTEKEYDETTPSNFLVRQLRDQLIRGKVYLSLSATRSNAKFIRELRLRIKEVTRALGEATQDSELPQIAHEKLKAMELTLAKGKQIQDDCSAVVKKLRAMLHSTEEQIRLNKKQTQYLTQLTAKTLPKGLHCLPLRLSTEYFMLNYSQQQFPNQEKLENPSLYHYALFSDNVLAAAVVVNSTVSHAKDPSNHVFHVVTDRLNYAAMRMWFLANPPGNATIQVQNVEEFTWLNSSYSPVLKQLNSSSMIDYYFKTRLGESDSNLKFRNPKYLSIMNHLRFYLPEIFPKLDKILFLDDDVVVQKDVTGLWSIDLKGKVIGVVETCGESFHRFDRYLNFSNPLISKNFDPRACGWAFGMNIIDLKEWRRQNITEVYHSWQNLNEDRLLWNLGTLPPGLITFWKRTHALDRSWHVLGLGYNPNVSQKDINRAAVIHYNGNLKPWLEIGIQKYRKYWTNYVDYDQAYLRECNINP